jgi:hypothetical protein
MAICWGVAPTACQGPSGGRLARNSSIGRLSGAKPPMRLPNVQQSHGSMTAVAMLCVIRCALRAHKHFCVFAHTRATNPCHSLRAQDHSAILAPRAQRIRLQRATAARTRGNVVWGQAPQRAFLTVPARCFSRQLLMVLVECAHLLGAAAEQHNRRLHLMKKPVIISMFPRRPRESSRIPLVVFGVLAGAAVAALAFGRVVPACVLAVLSTFFLEAHIDYRLTRICPHCGQRSMRVVGTGGIWYEHRQDLREERVFWGKCSCCSKGAVRRCTLGSSWTAYPKAEDNPPSGA